MIEGTDLRKVLKSGPMTPARAVAVVKQIGSALDAAHEAGITHRDVKPENIILNREDFAYLVDFGIANAVTDEKLTQLGTAVGTYAYMAPERFTNDEVTYRADVYALACVLHECLTGSQPYTGDSVGTIITAHLMNPTPRPSGQRPGIPPAFDQVIARGMAKKPADRFASAGDLATAATEALTHRSRIRPPRFCSAARPRPDPCHRHRRPSRGCTRHNPRHSPYPTHPRRRHPPLGRGVPHGPPASGPPSGPMWSTSPPARSGSAATDRGLEGSVDLHAAAAAVFVLILGGLGIWLGTRGDDDKPIPPDDPTSTAMSTSERTRTSRTPPPENPDCSRPSSCRSCRAAMTTACARRMARPPVRWQRSIAGRHPRRAALRTPGIRCSPIRQPSTGPSTIRWGRTRNCCLASNANADRRRGISPKRRQGRRQDRLQAFNGNQDITWTFNTNLLIGDAQGPDLADLHAWWLKFA